MSGGAGVRPEPTETMTIYVDGRPLEARAEQSVAGALLAQGLRDLGHGEHGSPRSVFCGIGACFQCVVCVAGVGMVRSCMEPVRPGLQVELNRSQGSNRGPAAPVEDPLAANPGFRVPDELDMEPQDLVVIGAGPAGMSAALEAADLGVEVLLLDEQARLGGQFFRQPAGDRAGPADPTAGRTGSPIPPTGLSLLRRVAEHPGIRYLPNTTVWGLSPEPDGTGGRVSFSGPEGFSQYSARTILVATGAYDRPLAFPGWSLPGVIGAGAAQALLKSQGILPGERLVLAGSHPLLLVVARDLVAAGADLLLVAFAQQPSWLRFLAELPGIMGHRAALLEAFHAWKVLKRAGVPVRFGHVVTRAEGDGRVEAVWLSRVDPRWYPEGEERWIRVNADALVLGYGLQAATELTRQAGAEHRWDLGEGGWVCRHDARMETSLPGIFVAGETAGVRGARVAMAEGALAAIAAAIRLGVVSGKAVEARLAATHRRVEGERKFARSLNRLTFPQPGLFSLIGDDVVVCRCHGLTAGYLRAILAEHPHIDDVNALKLLSRCGMGMCQGRLCETAARWLTAEVRGLALEQVGAFHVREPVKPVSIGDLIRSG